MCGVTRFVPSAVVVSDSSVLCVFVAALSFSRLRGTEFMKM